MNALRNDPSKLVLVYAQNTSQGFGDYQTAVAVANAFFLREGLLREQILLSAQFCWGFSAFNEHNFRVIEQEDLEYGSISLIVVARVCCVSPREPS